MHSVLKPCAAGAAGWHIAKGQGHRTLPGQLALGNLSPRQQLPPQKQIGLALQGEGKFGGCVRNGSNQNSCSVNYIEIPQMLKGFAFYVA